MFCSKCGKQIPDDSQFCAGCGYKIGSQVVGNEQTQIIAQPQILTKQRHGFVTFWLILCLSINILFLIMSLLGIFSIEFIEFVFEDYLPGELFYDLIIEIFAIIGFYLLLKWRKEGFAIIVLPNIIYYFIFGRYFYIQDLIISILIVIVINLVLFFILQIRKNGKSAWSQLESFFKGVN